MNVLARVAAVGAVTLMTAVVANPVMAASVDKSTFESKFTSVVSKAQVAPQGKSTLDTQVMTIPEPKMVFKSSKRVNANGSYVAKSSFLGNTQTRCVTSKLCYLTVDGGKNWRQVSPTDKGITTVDDALTYFDSLTLSPSATFDISGNTFTVSDESLKMVTVVTGSTVVTTVDLSNPSSPSETAQMVITHKPVKPVKVKKPKGVASGVPTVQSPTRL